MPIKMITTKLHQKKFSNEKRPLFLLAVITVLCTIIQIPSIVGSDQYVDLDMKNYPSMFISNGRLDVTFVVGEFANPGDVIATAEIAQSLENDLQKRTNLSSNIFELDITGNKKEELTKLYMDVLDKKKDKAAQLVRDTDLNSTGIIDQNLIIVGGPCVNWLSAYFMNYPSQCTSEFVPGRGYYKLFRNGKGVVMIVAGYSVDDTLLASNILSHHEDYTSNLIGQDVRVSSAMMQKIIIT